MSRFASITLAASLLAVAALPAHAEQTLRPQQVFTPAGTAVDVGEYYSIFPDCSLAPRDDFRVVIAPKHGKINKVRGEVVVRNPPPQGARCAGRSVMSTNAVYTPAKGYVGTDSVELELLIHVGTKELIPIDITVGGRSHYGRP